MPSLPKISVLIVVLATHAFAQTENRPLPFFELISKDGEFVIALMGLNDTKLRRIENANLPRDEIISIRVASSGESGPTLLGTYVMQENRIEFHPRFPLQKGTEYRATYGSLVQRIVIPNDLIVVTTNVSEIYPTASVLPANLLKFYIAFSAPMSRGYGYDYVRLYDERGNEVEDPFPAIGVELWDPNQKQFTLLLDPGRIKRGIGINVNMGLPLVPENAYVLTVDAAWPDATGKPLGQSFQKKFRVVEPDHESPDFNRWELSVPSSATSEPMVVTFGEAIDYSLADRFVWVEDADGVIVKGDMLLSKEETVWTFTRASGTWEKGEYAIGIHSRLEDLAGNQVEKPFEVDVESGPTPIAELKTYLIPFTIR